MKVYILTKPIGDITLKYIQSEPAAGNNFEVGKQAIFSALKEIDIDEALWEYLKYHPVGQKFSEYLEKL